MTFAKAATVGWAAVLRVVQGMARRAIEGATVVVTLVISSQAYLWAFVYASAALVGKQDPVGTAAVLAAILGPLTTLQGFVLVKYMEEKKSV
jgi:hypothetical protein